jgi:hypothetical protein
MLRTFKTGESEMELMPPKQTSGEAESDIAKDVVEHVRAVHFALILVCAGLWLAILNDKGRELEDAVKEITLIEKLSKRLVFNNVIAPVARQLSRRIDYHEVGHLELSKKA